MHVLVLGSSKICQIDGVTPTSTVTITVGSCIVSCRLALTPLQAGAIPFLLHRLTHISFLEQAASTAQTSIMPFWNEVLDVQVPSLPTFATIRLETSIANELSSSRTAEFEIYLTESLCTSFAEDKLVASKAYSTLASTSSEPVTLTISCSLDPALVAERQRGLWPVVARGGLLKSAPSHPYHLQSPQEPEFPLLNTPLSRPARPSSKPDPRSQQPRHSAAAHAPQNRCEPPTPPCHPPSAAAPIERCCLAPPQPLGGPLPGWPGVCRVSAPECTGGSHGEPADR